MKKVMKSTVSVLLAITMMVSLCAQVFAYNIYTGTIFENNFTSKPSSYGGRNTIVSPRSIELRHQSDPTDNGKMYLTIESGDVPDNGKTAFPIYESVDGGVTFTSTPVGYVKDTNNGWGNDNCPMLYELPAQLGDLPAGTLICGGIATTTRYTETSLDVYYSEDLGRNWTYLSTIDTGGDNNVGKDPLWEPYFLYDPATEKLICYYSDETDPNHSQKLVLKTTTDGVNWGEYTPVVQFNDPNQRPGMSIVSQMENGYYIMVFELYGQSGVPNAYKFSLNKDDPIHWDWGDMGAEFGYSGSPYVTTLADGTLMLNVFSSRDLYVNTRKDGLGMWQAVSSPVPAGYNRQLYPLSTGEVFINSTPIHSTYPKNVWYGTMAPPSSQDFEDTSTVNTLTVTTTSDGGSGTVSRMGEVQVNSTTPYWLEAIPDEGSEVKNVLVDGVSIGKSPIFRVTMETDKEVEVVFGDPTDVDRNTLYFVNRRWNTQHIVVPQGYTSPDVTVIAWERGNETGPEYEWYLRQADAPDTYQIENLKSGLVLGIKNASTSNNASVDQQTRLTLDNAHQLWEIEQVGNYYRFKNLKSGLMLAQSSSGGDIQQRTVNTTGTGNTFNQQCWAIGKVHNDPPKIITASLPDGVLGDDYSAALSAYGHVPVIAPLTWSLAEGALPDGLSLDPGTGVISGVPTAESTAGPTLFTVKAENMDGENTKELAILVSPQTAEPVTLEELEALCALAQAIDAGAFTTSSFAALAGPLAAAQAVVEEGGSEQKIREAYNALKEAIDALVARGDIFGLQYVVSQYDGQFEELRTSAAAWDGFAQAMQAGKAMLADSTDASQAEVDAAITALDEAVVAMIQTPINVTELAVYMADAETILANSDLHVSSVVEPLTNALNAARQVLAVRSSQSEVDAAAGALLEVVKTAFGRGDATALDRLAAFARTRVETLYTPDSWSDLVTALKVADTVLAMENPSDQEVEYAYTTLEDALNGLKLRQALNYSALDAAIARAADILQNSDKYVAATIAGLDTELASAQAVRADTGIGQTAMDDAAAALAAANAKARFKADLSKLQALLAEIEGFNFSPYTVASVKKVTDLMEQAKLLNVDDLQNDVNHMETALRQAMKNLKKKTVSDPNLNPANPDPAPTTPTVPAVQATPPAGTPPTTGSTGATATPSANTPGSAVTDGTAGNAAAPGADAPIEVEGEVLPDAQAPLAQAQDIQPKQPDAVNIWMILFIALVAVVMGGGIVFVAWKKRKDNNTPHSETKE